MALTPNYQWPTPEMTEAANGPSGFSALGNAIDTTVFSIDASKVPVGALLQWLTATAPAGWQICDGRVLDAALYPQLALVLGATAGQITLPDLRDRVGVGASATKALKSTGGLDKVALAVAELPAHAHGVTDPTHTHTTDAQGTHSHGGATTAADRPLGHAHSYTIKTAEVSARIGDGAQASVTRWPYQGAAGTGGEPAPDHLHGIYADGNHAHNVVARATGVSIQNTGSGTAHENLPPYVALNYIIRAA